MMIKRCHYKYDFEMSDSWYLPVEKKLIEWFDSQVSHITLGDCYRHTHTDLNIKNRVKINFPKDCIPNFLDRLEGKEH